MSVRNSVPIRAWAPGLPLRRAGREWGSAPDLAMTLLGAAALLAAVLAAGWLAAAAAGSPRWLELPTASRPGWIAGPLHGLGGTLSRDGLGAGLIVLTGAYGLALVCARRISLRAALVAIVLANLAFTLAPTLLSTDVFGYIAYARELIRHGLNPYAAPPSAIPHDVVLSFVYWRGEASPYGPGFTFAAAPLGLLSPAAALWTLKGVAGVAASAIAFLTARLARQRGHDPVRAALFVGLNPVVLFYAVSGAHIDLLGALLVLAAFGLALRGSDAVAGATAVGAAAIKVTFGLALPFVLVLARRRGRATAGAGIALLAVGVLTALLFGGHVFDQLHRITTQARFDTRFSGPDRLASVLGAHITTTLRAACAIASALAALWALWRASRGADPITAAGWAFAALFAAIASLAPWYLVWLLPLAALSSSRALRSVALLATVYLIATHLPALGGQPWLSAAG